MPVESAAAYCGQLTVNQPTAGPPAAAGMTRCWRSDHGWLARRGERSPTLEPAHPEGSLLVFKGRPFGLDATAQRLDPTAPADALAAMDGRFSLALIGERELVLATDALGTSGAFYHPSPDGSVYFASHLGLLITLLPYTPEPEPSGVAAMLAGSCQVAGRTHFQGIYRLPPAGYLHLTPGQPPQTRAYLSVTETFCPEPGSSPATPEALESVFNTAVAREGITGRDAIMLSGGLDSRVIAGSVAQCSNARPRCFTYGEGRSLDLRGARDVAHRLGLPHHRLPYSDWSFEGLAPYIAALTGGLAGLQTAHNTAGVQRLPDDVDSAVIGFLGDPLTGSHYPETSAAATNLGFRRAYGPRLEDHYGDALDSLEAEIGATHEQAGLGSAQAAILRDLTIRQASWISTTMDLWDWLVPVKTPFFNRDLIRFFLGLPEAELADQALYRRWAEARLPRRPRPGPASLRQVGYRLGHAVLDRIYWRTGLFPNHELVDWRRRITREVPFLRSIADATRDSPAGLILEGELERGNCRNLAPLLAGGHAYATRLWQPATGLSDSTNGQSAPTTQGLAKERMVQPGQQQAPEQQ